MKITETFNSIQGEGPEIGMSAMFIRVFGCNMIPKCDFCDSKYSWNSKGKRSILEPKEVLIKMINSNQNNFIFTGGEPTIYDNEISTLRKYCHGQHFSLETNGLLETKVNYNTIVVSPKKQNIDYKTLKNYSQKNNVYFKFVYENEKDLWWEKVIKKVKIDKKKVYIMPEGNTKKAQQNKMKEVIEYCKEKKLNFSPRLHVLTWGRKRKV